MNQIKFFALPFLLFLFSCASEPKRPELPPVNLPVEIPRINYFDVQESLGLRFEFDETGFREKRFDACFLGKALEQLKPPLRDCHQAYFSLLQFKLSCRASEDTSQVMSEADLRPVGNQGLKWSLDRLQGDIVSDLQGRGIIQVISNQTLRKAMLRISTGFDFLNMRAVQATAIVTPPSWCEAH